LLAACLLLACCLVACLVACLFAYLFAYLFSYLLLACSRDVPHFCWRFVVCIPNSDVISFPASTRPPSRQYEIGGKHVPARKLAGVWILWSLLFQTLTPPVKFRPKCHLKVSDREKLLITNNTQVYGDRPPGHPKMYPSTMILATTSDS